MFDFFIGFYKTQKEMDNMAAYVWDQWSKYHSCATLPYPSRDLRKRYGIREYKEVWAILERHFESYQTAKVPDQKTS